MGLISEKEWNRRHVGKSKKGFTCIAYHHSKKTYTLKCDRCGRKKDVTVKTWKNGTPGKCVRCDGKECAMCKKLFIPSGKNRFCSRTCKEQFAAHAFGRHCDAGRDITPTTKMLVCVYFSEGDDIDVICGDLKRNRETVIKILDECIENKRYYKFAEKSFFYNKKKTMERAEEFKKWQCL